jgi:hypothetical protein
MATLLFFGPEHTRQSCNKRDRKFQNSRFKKSSRNEKNSPRPGSEFEIPDCLHVQNVGDWNLAAMASARWHMSESLAECRVID